MADRDEVLRELGQRVTEFREAAGLTLEAVFDRTKIRPEYLKGIEAGDYEGFPETVYIKGFIRTYLKLIGGDELYDDFAACLDSSDVHRKSDPKPQNKNMKNILGNGSSLPKGFKPATHFWLFLVLIAALLGTAGYVWYAVSYGGLDLRNLKLFNFNGAGGPLTTANVSTDVAAVELSGDIESVTVSEDVSADEEQEEEEQVSPYLEIHAVNDVWLSVSFGGAQPVFRRTMRRGDSMRWELTAPARVVIGRPTAAQVILNGQDLGVVNPRARRSETYIYNPDGTYRQVTRQ